MRLNVSHLTVRYGALTVVEDVSFDVSGGDWLMIVGPNGAGKSTIINALMQTAPYTGGILLDGAPLSAMPPRERARRIGSLAQSHHIGYAYSVEEIVRLGRYAHRGGALLAPRRDADGDAAVERALAETGLLNKRGQSVLTLSGGELQRTFLAQLLAQDPPLMALDEPTNHLDPVYQRQVFDQLDLWRRTSQRAIVSVVHDLSLAKKYGTRALLLKNGRTLALGACDEALSGDNLAAAYDMDLTAWMRELSAQWQEGTDERK